MFDETKEEKYRSAIVGGIYCVLVLLAFWFFSRQAFWYTVGAIVVVSGVAGLYLQKKPKRC